MSAPMIFVRADGCEVGSWPLPPEKLTGIVESHPMQRPKVQAQAEAQLEWSKTHGQDMAWHISEFLAKNPKATIAVYAR